MDRDPGLTARGAARADAAWTGVRFVLYTAVVLGLAACLPVVARRGGGLGAFTDGGPVEWGQFAVLSAVTVGLWAGAWRMPSLRVVLVVLGSLAAFAAVRESDFALNDTVPLAGWKFGFVFPVLAAVYAALNGDAFWAQVGWMLRRRAFVVLWAGFMVAMPIGQLVGHGELLRQLMGEEYDHHYKHAIEEMLESVGYLVLACGTVEVWAEGGREETERRRDEETKRRRDEEME